MKIPANVRKIVDGSQIDQSIHFVEILGTIRGEPCLRLYAYKHTKSRGKECKEVGRRFVDRDLVSGSLYYTRLGGYNVIWSGKKRIGYYYELSEDNHFYEVTDNSDLKYPHRYFKRLYTSKEVEDKFKGADEWLNYLFVPELTDIDDTMNYIRAYREHPMLEKLAKGGFGYLWDDKLIYRLGYENHKKLVAFLKNNRNYLIENKPNYGWISQAIKKGMTAEEFDFYEKTEELTRSLKEFKYSGDLITEMCRYMLKQASGVDVYYDYLSACKKLGMNYHDRGIIFPRNLEQSHDSVTELLDEKENKATNKGLKKAFEILQKFIENTGEFQLVIPKSCHDLIKWGDKLHCCVGKMGYGAKMAKGETIILGVFLNGQIVECCEIGLNYQKEMSVLQLHGDHNLDSPYHEEAQTLTNQFLMNYKPQNLMGAVI